MSLFHFDLLQIVIIVAVESQKVCHTIGNTLIVYDIIITIFITALHFSCTLTYLSCFFTIFDDFQSFCECLSLHEPCAVVVFVFP